MVSPSIGIRGAARWRIENHSLQRGRADLFQNRLPPNERSPDTGAILSIRHASAIGSSALAAAPLSLDSHSGTPKFPTLTTHPKGVQYCQLPDQAANRWRPDASLRRYQGIKKRTLAIPSRLARDSSQASFRDRAGLACGQEQKILLDGWGQVQ